MRPLTLLFALQIFAVVLAQQSTPLEQYLATYPDCAVSASFKQWDFSDCIAGTMYGAGS